MKRVWLIGSVVVAMFALSLWTLDAWARAGGGTSSGSRGSRSYSAPARPSPSPGSPSQPAAPTSPQQRPGGLFGGLMGGIGGFLLGGLIGSLLFGGMGGGLFGGIGLLEILIIAGLIYFALSYARRRQEIEPAPATGGAYSGGSSWSPGNQSAASATVEAPAVGDDLERGIRNIRQMDATFDPVSFADAGEDFFFKVQAGWMSRDMASARDLLTAEMYAGMQKDCDRLRAQRRINRLENIAVRSAEITEAWQESGQDYVTVRFLANLLDYTVDEATGQVLEGSRTEPVKFEEYWTFVRPVGPNRWKLSAIQQPA